MSDALKWLDRWELNLENGLKKENEFLSRQTFDGLKITINSTIDLTNYLLDKCEFSYVLTSKFNQDSLEVMLYIKMYMIYNLFITFF